MLQSSGSFSTTRPRAIANWLFVVAAMIIAMVAVGGVTRLTESGLSITQWKPISGILPPLNDAQWQAEFAHYKQYPQYRLLNQGMSLAGFKAIFFWEYVHRLLGRTIGLVFGAPLVWFAVKRQIPKGYTWKLVTILALGGFQGVLGWWMVQSGMVGEHTHVAPGWLAAHLLTALFTMGATVWVALDLHRFARKQLDRPARLSRVGAATLAILFVQLFYGALVAGLRAGLVTDQWPLMNGHFFPSTEFAAAPFPASLISDPYVVHFIHRWWAWVVVAAMVVLARRAKAAGNRAASIAIHCAFGTQVLLGIATVMTGVSIPLAALHQLTGALLVAATVWGAHAVGRRR
jgi:cytochrome c oxidase assembly protein subunit 15